MFCWAIHQFICLGQLLPVAGRLRRRVARGAPPANMPTSPNIARNSLINKEFICCPQAPTKCQQGFSLIWPLSLQNQ